MKNSSLEPGPQVSNPIQLSVIISTLSLIGTARLLADRVRVLLAALKIEVIVVCPLAGGQANADGLVKHIVDSGGGVYAAYGAGLKASSGEYVWFIGDDDYPLDAAVDICGPIQAGVADLLIAPVLFSSGRIYRPSRTLLFLHFLNWCQQGVIYRRRELIRYRFFRRLPVQADQYVNIRMRSDPAVRMIFLAKPICMFGVHGTSAHALDAGYRSLRVALAHRTLNCGGYLMFRVLTMLEPLIKRIVRIR